MQTLEYVIDTADGGTFTTLAAAFLRSRGYRTKEFRVGAGEWSARIWMRDRSGIACASIAADWRAALRSSARKAKRIERDRDEEYSLFVFVTNRDVTGLQEFDMEDEVAREYGWRLRLYHRQDLVGELYNTAPGLAKHHLDVNLGFETGHLATLEELRDERIDAIVARRGEATGLREGPAVALHVVPNGIFTTEKRWASSELPVPGLLSGPDPEAIDARSEVAIAYGREIEGEGEYAEYALLGTNGLYEAATTTPFDPVAGPDGGEELAAERGDDRERASEPDHAGDGPWLRAGERGSRLDGAVVAAARRALAGHAEMGFSATASVWISVLGAGDARLDPGAAREPSPSTLGAGRYSTRVTTAAIADRERNAVAADLEPALSELWRAFGHPEGSPYVGDGERSAGADGGDREPPGEAADDPAP